MYTPHFVYLFFRWWASVFHLLPFVNNAACFFTLAAIAVFIALCFSWAVFLSTRMLLVCDFYIGGWSRRHFCWLLQSSFLRVLVAAWLMVFWYDVHHSVGGSLSIHFNLEEDWLKGSLFSFTLCVATGEKRDYTRQKEHCPTIFRETFHHDKMKRNDSG